MSATTRWTALCAALLGAACRGSSGTLRVAGTVEIRDVRLAALTSGRLDRLLKDEGDTVHRGDTVAVLTQPGLDALIGQRRAQAHAAAQRVAEVTAAQADSARATNDLARADVLRRQNIISQQQYDAFQAAAAGSAARLEAVRAAPSESAAASAAVAGALATRDELTITAPDDGVVLVRDAEPGEVLTAGAPVVTLGLVRRPWIRAYVGDRFIGRIRVGQTATVRADAEPDHPFQATVTEIAPQAEFTPRAALTERERADLVFGVKVEPTGGDEGGRLKAGMPVTLELPLLP